MTELERIDLHLAEDDHDAAALLHELEQKGIEGVVARGAKGPIVRVSADDQERAKAVLRAWLGEDREPPARASKLGWDGAGSRGVARAQRLGSPSSCRPPRRTWTTISATPKDD